MLKSEPEYIALYQSGELKQRAEALEARLLSCNICPRECSVNRLKNETKFCHSGYLPIVSSVCAHHGEEPVISGNRGSGTIFFGNCNMRCVYCQNHQISQNHKSKSLKEITPDELAKQMLYLQNNLGCHNINFVSPSHFVPQVVKAVFQAIPLGLRLPLVYNTNSYDSIDSLKALEGIMSIYLADIKYASDKWSKKLSNAKDYVEVSRTAIKEMYRQVGNLVLNENGVAIKGLIVRHLILPDNLAGSEDSLKWLADEVSPKVAVSIMSQYYPAFKAPETKGISRRITSKEYADVVRIVNELGLENGWMQKMDSSDNYLPDFAREGDPFSPTVD